MNRIKVRINHHPVNYNAVGLTINILLAFIMPLWLWAYGSKNSSPLLVFLFFIPYIINVVAVTFLGSINGFLSADDEKLHFRYVKNEKDILFSDITEISYGTYTEYNGRYSQMRISLIIKTTDGEEHIFNDKIDTEQMNAAFDISGSGNVPMIKMYSYLAARLPDRAKGFVKPEKETGDMLL